MMDFESQSVDSDSSGFDSQLTREIERKTKIGNDGVGEQRQKFNFYMSVSVQDLGSELAKKQYLDPKTWAAWMCNTELDLQDEKVMLRVPSQFVAKTIIDKFGTMMRNHFKKPIFAKIDADLDRHMKRL